MPMRESQQTSAASSWKQKSSRPPKDLHLCHLCVRQMPHPPVTRKISGLRSTGKGRRLAKGGQPHHQKHKASGTTGDPVGQSSPTPLRIFLRDTRARSAGPLVLQRSRIVERTARMKARRIFGAIGAAGTKKRGRRAVSNDNKRWQDMTPDEQAVVLRQLSGAVNGLQFRVQDLEDAVKALQERLDKRGGLR